MSPPGSRKKPYGMRITMMEGIHLSASTYADNVMVVVSPINLYLALGSVINNHGRIVKPQGGPGYFPQGIPSLTTSSLQYLR